MRRIILAILAGTALDFGAQAQDMLPIGGSGATSSSVTTALTILDLKANFGAACDGVTDDTTAIKHWLNAAAANVRLTAPAGVCLFSAPVTMPYANYYTLIGAGPGATEFRYTGLDYNGTVTADPSAGAWISGATSITLSSAALPTNITTAVANGYTLSAWDTTTGKFIGKVTGPISGTTMPISSAAYAGSNGDSIHLTTDLLTISGTGSGGEKGVKAADFEVTSNTVLTGGYAIHAHGIFDSVFDSVWADHINGGIGNLCGGVWFDGVSGVNTYSNPFMFSKQNCGDGVLANSALGASADLRLIGGNIGGVPVANSRPTGFISGYHVGGGMGGVECVGTDIHNNGTNGILVDDQMVATANREIKLGAQCAADTNGANGLLVDDTLASGGTVDVDGWVASTQNGPGINIQSWPSGDVEIRGDKVYNNCASGIYVQDSTTKVLVNRATAINTNGRTAISAYCTSNSGHQYGIEASVATTNIFSTAAPWNNPSGPFNLNSGLQSTVQKFAALADVTAATPVCSGQGCTAGTTGSGYGTSVTGGTMTLISGAGGFTCPTPPVLNVTTNGSGVITTVNSITTAGSCTAMGATQNATWTPGSGLSAGSGALFNLTWTALTQTYTPTAGMRFVRVYSYGAGGQGGGGANVTSGTASSGGAGGGAGGENFCDFTAAEIGTSQSLTVGLGGRNGGAPGTTASSSGAIGQAGGQTFFGASGTKLCAAGGGGAGFNGINAATASGGGAGAGWGQAAGANGASNAGGTGSQGGASGTTGSAAGTPTTQNAGGGGSGSSATGAAFAGGGGFGGGAGGGSAGGLTTGPATSAGGNGGAYLGNGSSTAAGGTAGAANANGNPGNAQTANPSASADCGSAGGGGGSGLTTTTAGNGGAGATCSGGGGGGSVVSGTGSAAGYGGPGGDGEIDVVEFF